jgi:pilus assembly protein TadC
MTLFGLIVTILVLIGMVIFILLFERRRAREIEHDLHDLGDQRREEEPPTAR